MLASTVIDAKTKINIPIGQEIYKLFIYTSCIYMTLTDMLNLSTHNMIQYQQGLG